MELTKFSLMKKKKFQIKNYHSSFFLLHVSCTPLYCYKLKLVSKLSFSINSKWLNAVCNDQRKFILHVLPGNC